MDTILETIDLTKDFRGRRAVDGLSLCVREGDVYGFLGPNGAGKSTTIRMLTGLVRPNRGYSRVLGLDIRRQREEAMRGVGALVESPAFYMYLSARENLEILSRLSGGYDRKRVDQVLDIVGLLDRAKDRVKTYSHGMRQRLGIAQALLPNPRLVILDEPTNGLDPQGMKDVRELILRLSNEEKITVFLSSHLLHEVEQVCTRVGIINRGRLIAEGDVQQLVRSDVEQVEVKVGDANAALGILEKLDWVRVVDTVVLSGRQEHSSTNPPTRPLAHSPVQIDVRCPQGRIPEMNRALVTGGVDVYGISPKISTLEELFFQLVEEGERAH